MHATTTTTIEVIIVIIIMAQWNAVDYKKKPAGVGSYKLHTRVYLYHDDIREVARAPRSVMRARLPIIYTNVLPAERCTLYFFVPDPVLV